MSGTRYKVLIDHISNDPGPAIIDEVLDYVMTPCGAFYVAGTDFEQWWVLSPGDVVTVTED